MFELGFVILMFVLQWLSIWAGVAKIDKKDTAKRKNTFYQTFCTMGLPAIIGLIITIIFFFAPIDTWISIIIYIALSIIFAFNGNVLYQKFFIKEDKKKNNKKNVSSKKGKK